jgi:transcriptional antiterminator RfaH
MSICKIRTNIFRAGWYLIYTRPNQEKKVSVQLQEKKMRYFLPTSRTIRQWGDRKKMIDTPLFPSYVFVYLGNLADYYAGLDAEGVIQFVKAGKDIVSVRETVIENIRLVVEKCEAVEVVPGNFQPGIKAVINYGPLTGLECEVIECRGRQRIVVGVNILNRYVLADMHPSYLEMPLLEGVA